MMRTPAACAAPKVIGGPGADFTLGVGVAQRIRDIANRRTEMPDLAHPGR
jgi:hypothetical protein